VSLLLVNFELNLHLLMICHSDLINSLFYTVLTQAEINRFMEHLFDKDLPTARLASVLEPYYSENPPHTVSIIVFFLFLFTLMAHDSIGFANPGSLPTGQHRCGGV
jgi:hypothetical protein